MYNLRYHIASLVAVFLALSVGLLLGTVVVERGTLDRQRAGIVDSLQEDFAQLSAENEEARLAAERHERFGEDLARLFSDGRLAGRTVLVLNDSDGTAAAEAAEEAVRAGGGEAVGVKLHAAGLDVARDSTLAEDERVKALLLSSSGREETASVLAAALAEELVSAGPRPLVEALMGADVLEGDLPQHADAVVLALPSESGGEAVVAVRLALGLLERDVTVVGVGSAEDEPVGVGPLRDTGISTVGHVDMPEGMLSLVWVLSGGAEGRFGIDDEAEALYPRLVE